MAKAIASSNILRGALAAAVIIIFVVAGTEPAHAVNPCCDVTAINPATHVVTAREVRSGRLFQFTVNNAAALARLRVGQAVYANFAARQVSLDGRSVAGTITAIAAAPAIPAARPGGSAPAPAATPPAPASKPTTSSSSAPNTGASTVPANISASEPTTTGAIRGATASNPPAASGNITVTNSRQSAPSVQPGALGPVARAPQIRPIGIQLPQVTVGPPQVLTAGGAISRTAIIPPGSRASRVNQNVIHLRGIEDIAAATDLPQGARDFLILHARSLPPNEVDHYIVNKQLAEQWFRDHPEPEDVHQAATHANTHAGCHAISMHCAGEAAKHAEGEAERQSEALLQQAQDEWRHVTGEVSKDWNAVEGCFADHTLQVNNIPVKFTDVTPEISLNYSRDGKTSNQYGSASGSVSGSVAFGIPMSADFNAQLDLFYIPCLPFAVRPRSLGASGVLSTGNVLQTSVAASGQFDQLFTIPPTGGPRIPIEVFPIVIAGVPVAEMDVSVYFDGTLEVDGKGNFRGDAKLESKHLTNFDFACSGSGCALHQQNVSLPVTTTESAQIQGRLHIKPAVYAALQLDFDVDALSARAGPQPYLLGEIYGCSSTTASQTQGGPSTAQERYALTADLDWGLELRAEALVGNKKVGEKKWNLLQRHIAFRDLAHSNALVPAVSAGAQLVSGEPIPFAMQMPACYPYTDPIEYRVRWSGGAVASNGVPANSAPLRTPAILAASRKQPASAPGNCTTMADQSDCWGNPLQPTALTLVWPSPGNYALSVTAVGDKHGRKFDSGASAQAQITVSQPPAPSGNR